MEPTDLTRDPERDPALASALRDAYGPVPEIDFAALRGAIVAQAELPLARARKARRSPWSGRFRAFAPLAAAAGIAGTVLALHLAPGQDHARTPTASERQQVDQVLNEAMPDLHELVAGQGGGDQLLNVAVGS
jgi:hypothetical protein